MRIVVFGAGVQGTLFAVRLSLGGHDSIGALRRHH
jgi:ketopantoate reductase